MSFVFLSHANKDKPKIRHIVDALIAAGFKVWLDNPSAMGVSAKEIKEHFHRLKGGDHFRDQIDEGLREAGAVLVCWSEAARQDRNVWFSEATVARTLQKLVACHIDDVELAVLPDKHGEEQILDLRKDLPASGRYPLRGRGGKRRSRSRKDVETQLELLISDVKAKMTSTSGRDVEQRKRRQSFIPYLINRTKQEEAFASAIGNGAEVGSVHPFLITGPENECIDEFLERVTYYTCPQQLGGQLWQRVSVEWPFDERPAKFGEHFQSRLAQRLGLRTQVKDDEIARCLAQRNRTVAVVSLMRAEEWQADEPQRIKEWLSWWQHFHVNASRLSVFPILCVKMPAAKAGWQECPRGWTADATMTRRIWREAKQLRAQGDGFLRLFSSNGKVDLPLEVPPMLHPVSEGDSDRWLREDHVKEHSAFDTIKSTARRLFTRKCYFRWRETVKQDVTLEDFATAMRPIFNTSRSAISNAKVY